MWLFLNVLYAAVYSVIKFYLILSFYISTSQITRPVTVVVSGIGRPLRQCDNNSGR